jgi:hypothetical protein
MKRGRPLKFGRSAELLALTLPHDVVSWLRTINDDPAWAIVRLFERHIKRGPMRPLPRPSADLVAVGRRRALIVVDHDAITTLPGVAVIPLGAGRSFLSLEAGRGMADLEVAVVDRLDERGLPQGERKALSEFRRQLRTWRKDPELGFETRSIIVVARQQTARRPSAARRTRKTQDDGAEPA